MEQYPKISIVTPNFNGAQYLEKTIVSIISQHYSNLEYIIIDGGSTDGSVEIIKKYEKDLTYWISEKDNGMYNALQKGFDKSTGEIMGWLNSDDLHHSGSLSLLAQVFTEFKNVNWLQGTPNIIDESERIVFAAPRPEVDRDFFYHRKHISSGKYIQQESTFWRRSLWEVAGSYISQKYKYAGDFELWIRFFKHQQLHLLPALLGAFRISRRGQASVENYKEYVAETLQILQENPLSASKNREMKYMRILEKLERRFNLFARINNKLRLKHRTVVSNEIHFDKVSQQFKL